MSKRAKIIITCPHCKGLVDASEAAAQAFGARGGSAGKGPAKARTPEQARAAALAGWVKRRRKK